MYLYTEFPDIGICGILWYFFREHNFESLNQHLISWTIINKIKISSYKIKIKYIYIARDDRFLQIKANYNMLRSVLTTKGQLQHVNISNDNNRSIIAHCDQFWRLKVDNNTLQSVLTIKFQLQHVAISFWYLKVNYNMLWLFLIIKRQLQHITISSDN